MGDLSEVLVCLCLEQSCALSHLTLSNYAIMMVTTAKKMTFHRASQLKKTESDDPP